MFDHARKIATDRPIVAVVTDRVEADGVAYDTVRTRYLEALRETALVVPILLPCSLTKTETNTVLGIADGLLMTGAVSNVAPSLYGDSADVDCLLDTERDSTVMASIKIALATDLPILGICRGLQELNVALGGTLDRDLSNDVGRADHTEDLTLARDLQYSPTHEVYRGKEGFIASCLKDISPQPVHVNSLHAQCIRNLSGQLSVDAKSPDGVIEAVSVKSSSTFAAAVQWHPEWFHASDKISQAIFTTFGQACFKHREKKGSL